MLADLRKGHPQGLRESKRVVNAELLEKLDRRGDEMAELSARLFGSDAAREAMLAFLSRKKLSDRSACGGDRTSAGKVTGLP